MFKKIELRLELLFKKGLEVELIKLPLSFSASEIRFCILDFRLSANWVETEEFIIEFDSLANTVTNEEVTVVIIIKPIMMADRSAIMFTNLNAIVPYYYLVTMPIILFELIYQ